ncbi:MAG: carboxypeptidase regulatory-like domain-containing protein, partial [Sphingobacteriales bacterium]
MKKLLLPFACIVLGLLSSCDPNDDASTPSTPSTFEQNFGSMVSRDFIGQIVNVSNQPIGNATVTVGDLSVQTDASGVFIINGASVHEKFAYVTAGKTGYIDGSRSLVPNIGKNSVRIMLLDGTVTQTVTSGQPSEVSISSGTKVNFDGSFEDENGAAYNGMVGVYVFHLTASNPDIASLMPGMLYAETETGNEAVLKTFGMLNVELRGSGGQKLQIASGHTAQITMRIDDNQLATAPQSIPLWHFDADKGWWIEDGTATRQGNNYIGNVSHFSWWNCDTFASTVNLTVTVHDARKVGLELGGFQQVNARRGRAEHIEKLLRGGL